MSEQPLQALIGIDPGVLAVFTASLNVQVCAFIAGWSCLPQWRPDRGAGNSESECNCQVWKESKYSLWPYILLRTLFAGESHLCGSTSIHLAISSSMLATANISVSPKSHPQRKLA